MVVATPSACREPMGSMPRLASHVFPFAASTFDSRHQVRLARLFGLDPTWGYSKQMAEAIGCTPIELATPQELVLDPPPMTAAQR